MKFEVIVLIFGENLRSFRIASGYTQEMLAKKLNLSKANVSKYESGIIEPNLSTMISISKLFKVSVDSLLGLSEFSETVAKPSLVATEQQLINNYRQLNEEGQEKLLDLSTDLVSSGRYIKSNKSQMVSEA